MYLEEVVLLPHSFTQYFKLMSVNNFKSNPIKTVLVITVGMLVVYYLTNMEWAIIAALLIGSLGLLSNYFALKIEFIWMKLAWVLSLIIPNILLSLIFYLFLTPIAFLSRVFGEKNQLSLKNSNNSLFKDKPKAFDKASFEKPW